MSLNGGQGKVKLLTEWVKIFPLTYSLIFFSTSPGKIVWLQSFKSFYFYILLHTRGGWVRRDTGAQKGELYIGKSSLLDTYYFWRETISPVGQIKPVMLNVYGSHLMVLLISANRHISQPLQL